MKELERWFYVVMIAGAFCGGILWLSSINSKADASADALKTLGTKVDQAQSAFEEIRIRLAHIEDSLKN